MTEVQDAWHVRVVALAGGTGGAKLATAPARVTRWRHDRGRHHRRRHRAHGCSSPDHDAILYMLMGAWTRHAAGGSPARWAVRTSWSGMAKKVGSGLAIATARRTSPAALACGRARLDRRRDRAPGRSGSPNGDPADDRRAAVPRSGPMRVARFPGVLRSSPPGAGRSRDPLRWDRPGATTDRVVAALSGRAHRHRSVNPLCRSARSWRSGMREGIMAARTRGVPVIAVSGIVGARRSRTGRPHDAIAGHESSATTVATIWPIADGVRPRQRRRRARAAIQKPGLDRSSRTRSGR